MRSARAARVVVAPGTASRWLAGRGGEGWLAEAVASGGGDLVSARDADALIWTEVSEPEALAEMLEAHPQIRWVQLPFAGIEPYRDVLDRDHIWTCAKAIYGDSVAEHTLALLLAGFRDLGHYLRSSRWDPLPGRNLFGARVLVLGGGGIARQLLRLLAPFEVESVVVRRHPSEVPGAGRVVGPDQLLAELAWADAVVVALALTPETEGIIDAEALSRMRGDAWLVNVARGRHVVTAALVEALGRGAIGGAALDVTDPEPLPADHPLWSMPNCLLTPHVANTFEMLRPRLARMITENVRRWGAGRQLLGVVDPEAGY